MEIVKEQSGSAVRFSVPTDLATATYTITRGDVVLGGTRNATVANGVATASIPYTATTQDGDITVQLRFNSDGELFQPSKKISVVTPHLDIFEVKELLETDDTKEAMDAEAAARHIINAHCGQTFGKFVGKISVTGNGDTFLRMPRRLISYNSINGNLYWPTFIALRGGGWFMQTRQLRAPSIRADFDGWHEEPNGVIVGRPHAEYGKFVSNQEYEIDGVWGWEQVPDQVREASKLLVQDYASGDALYRDRFISSMSAADWRIQFHDSAFSDTGNGRANQLLAPFVLRRGWSVI